MATLERERADLPASEQRLEGLLAERLEAIMSTREDIAGERAAHDAEMERKAAELTDIERRISEARELLSAAHEATERDREQRAAFEERLQALASLTEDVSAESQSAAEDRASEPAVEPEVLVPEVEPATAQSEPDAEATVIRETVESPADEPQAPSVEPVAEPSNGTTRRRRGLRRRGRSGGSAARCAVCSAEGTAGSEQGLRDDGWILHDGGSVCPQCQSEGWKFPEGSALPFRSAEEAVH
jgi:hypothetical protein